MTEEFKIVVGEIWTGEYNSRRPLSALDRDENCHVHGRLELRFGKRVLPHLGFFGPDDVCLNTWLEELTAVISKLRGVDAGEYIFDEGEQGQPAFVFRKNGGSLAVSIEASLLSGASGDDDWGVAQCSWLAFAGEVSRFKVELKERITTEASDVGGEWWAEWAKE